MASTAAYIAAAVGRHLTIVDFQICICNPSFTLYIDPERQTLKHQGPFKTIKSCLPKLAPLVQHVATLGICSLGNCTEHGELLSTECLWPPQYVHSLSA